MSGAWIALFEGSRALLSGLRIGKRNAQRRLHGLVRLSEIAGAHTVVVVPRGANGDEIVLRKGGVLFIDVSSLEPAAALDVIAQLRIEGLLVSDARNEPSHKKAES